MKKYVMGFLSLALAAFLAIPLATLAANPGQNDRAAQAAAAQRAKVANDLHLLRIVGLADALGLNDAQALRLDQLMHPFDERRKEVRAQINEASKIVKRATEGDSSALTQVDQANQTILEGRVRVAEIDRDMFIATARELIPEQRAKMVIFFAKFGEQARQTVMAANKLRQAQRNSGPQNPGNVP